MDFLLYAMLSTTSHALRSGGWGRKPGLATVLSLLGLSATLAGRVMGNGNLAGGLGETLLPLGASVFAVAMGLNVLELVRVDLPSFEGGLDYITSLPRNARAFVLGERQAGASSPRSRTPRFSLVPWFRML